MVYDVSVPITNRLAVWPNDPPVKLTPLAHASSDKSHTIRLTRIEMGSHTGTHIDAPWHFVEGGRKLNEIPLTTLVGPVRVIEISEARSIQRTHLESLAWTGIE